MRTLAFGVMGTMVLAGPVNAASPGVGMRGDTPLVCSAGVDPPGGGSGAAGMAIGQLREFCNAPDGYEVWIDYPSDLVGAVLVVDGTDLPLTAARSVRVSQASGPAEARHRLQLRAGPARRTATLTVRMMPAPAEVQ